MEANSLERMLTMKKYFIGFVIGALLMLSGNALADTTIKNMMGRVIQGQLPVLVDGVALGSPAIVIDGVAYLPVRKFAESVGYAVNFSKEGNIQLAPDLSKIPIIHGMSPEAQADQDAKNKAININGLINQIERAKAELVRLEEVKISDKAGYLEMGGKLEIYETADSFKAIIESIAKQEAVIAELETRKADLEEQ